MTATRAKRIGAGVGVRSEGHDAQLDANSSRESSTPQDQSQTRLRALGYTRVSTDDQEIRTADDVRRIEAACVAWEWDLVDVAVDPGVSGKVPLAEREYGARVAALITPRRDALGRRSFPRVREADVVIVSNLDRLTRDTEDGLAIIRDLVPYGRRDPVRLVSLDDHIDLTTASGRMFAKLKLLFADYERELIGERTANAAHHRRATGRAYSSRTPPYGWDHDGDVMVPNDREQVVIAQMRADRARSVPLNAIAARLNRAGVPGKLGGRWQAVTVSRILAIVDAIEGGATP